MIVKSLNGKKKKGEMKKQWPFIPTLQEAVFSNFCIAHKIS